MEKESQTQTRVVMALFVVTVAVLIASIVVVLAIGLVSWRDSEMSPTAAGDEISHVTGGDAAEGAWDIELTAELGVAEAPVAAPAAIEGKRAEDGKSGEAKLKMSIKYRGFWRALAGKEANDICSGTFPDCQGESLCGMLGGECVAGPETPQGNCWCDIFETPKEAKEVPGATEE